MSPAEAICAAVAWCYTVQAAVPLLERIEALERRSAPVPVGYWRTRDGEVLRIEEMDTSHLKACIAGYAKGETLLLMQREVARR